MTTDKFIRVKKGNDFYYYRCSDYNASGLDCFNFMRSDLNRILYSSLPSGSIQIDCSGSSTTSSTTTSSTTTLYPCDIAFSTVAFVNNSTYPYDYVTQSGYVVVDMVNSQYPRLYQFKIVSGNNTIRDWTTPISGNNFAFKLNCANYTIYVRDYNDQSCQKELLNINVPCLTTTTSSTSSTTTSSTTTLPTTSSTSTTSTTSTTTVPPYTPCGVFGIQNTGNIYYYEPETNTNRIVLQNNNLVANDISYYNNQLYLLQSTQLSILNLANNTSSSIPTALGGKQVQDTAQCHDSNGNLYGAYSYIVKYINSGSYIVESDIITELSRRTFTSGINSTPSSFNTYSQGDMFYIQGLNSFVISVYENGASQLYIVKADGSGLILRKYNLGTFETVYTMFVYNNTLYLGNYTANSYKTINLNTGQLSDVSINLPRLAGGTQNPLCGNISTIVDDFSISKPVVSCVDSAISWTFTISGGSGVYQYSYDGVTYTNVTGNSVSVLYPRGYYVLNYTYEIYSIFIKDVTRNIVYEVILNNRNGCIPVTTSSTTSTTSSTTSSTTTSTTSTTTTTSSTTTQPPCLPISSVVIGGNSIVDMASVENYSVSYTGSPVTAFYWDVIGGTIIGSRYTDSVIVTWDGGLNSGQVSVTLTNCNGTSTYSKYITINNNV